MSDLLIVVIPLIVFFITTMIFLILWLLAKKSQEYPKGYDPQTIYEIRKELRPMHDNIKSQIGELFVGIDKLLEGLQR
jgi:hypothetical protein